MIDSIEFCNDEHGTVGEEYTITDSANRVDPKRTAVEGKALGWLMKDYEDDYPLRLLARKGTLHELLRNPDSLTLTAPFSEPITKDVLSSSSMRQYQALLQGKNIGGSFCTPNLSPSVFVIQTPYDEGPFCSMALMTLGRALVRGVYFYTDESYNLSKVLKDSTLYSGWRSSGFHIIVLPLAFLEIHVAQVSRDIQQVVRQISIIEDVIAIPRRPDNDNTDLSMLTRKLYECNTAFSKIERRMVFNLGLVGSIEQYIAVAEKARTTGTVFVKAPLEALKSMIESHKHDIKVLPKRIETQQTMIFYLTIHRDSYFKLQIADDSRRIAEASMKDSASMKTIAILTMLFLPGTAVASFFSMTMFDWNPSTGQPLASGYIWIYFVVAIPLTLFVMFVWYTRTQRRGSILQAKIDHKVDAKVQYNSEQKNSNFGLTNLNDPERFHGRPKLAHRLTAHEA